MKIRKALAMLWLMIASALGGHSTFAQTIDTFVGNGAAVMAPPLVGFGDVVVGSDGSIYTVSANSNAVVRVDPVTHISTVFAGRVAAGFAGDGGPAASALLSSPVGLALDSAGNLFIADQNNYRIRMVTPAGTISTVAGNGTFGNSGDGGLATSASVYPSRVQVDLVGNVYIVDSLASVIRKFSVGGNISTVAGTGTRGYTGDGGPATVATLSNPLGVAIDAAGNLYVADSGNAAVRKIDPFGSISTVVGGNGSGCGPLDGSGLALHESIASASGVAVDAGGNLYVATGGCMTIGKVTQSGAFTVVAGTNLGTGSSGDGGPATKATFGGYIPSVAVDSGGNLFINDANNHVIREVMATDGIVTTVVGGRFGLGDGGAASGASLPAPLGLAFDSAGNLYISDDSANLVRKVTPGGIISTIAGDGAIGLGGDGGQAIFSSVAPAGIVVDSEGSVLIADFNNHVIRKVSSAGIISTIAGTGTAGDSGDGGPAVSARMNVPWGLALDASGNLYVSEQTGHRVRMITPTGIISTFAGNGTPGNSGDGGPATLANLNDPQGLAVDSTGNVYIADIEAHVIRRVTPTGIISTYAGNGGGTASGDGGPAIAASIGSPAALAFDGAGILYLSDVGNHVIRAITPAGAISTIAGNGVIGFSGDGGPAIAASLFVPTGLVVDTAGTLYLADSGNMRIRRVSGLIANDTTPPVITPTVTGTQGLNGWYTSAVTVTWQVTDPESAVITTAGCDPTTISSDTVGQTLTCTATSVGGTTSKTATVKIDATPPIATTSILPVPNGNGWNNTNVTVTFSGSDALSGIASCGTPVTLMSEGANQTSTAASCTDRAGNVSVAVSANGINIDKTPPHVDALVSSAPSGGWYTTNVGVTFVGTDGLSGIPANGCTLPQTLSQDGAGQAAAGNCVDRAGNVGTANVTGINIDQSPPVASAVATPPPNANGWNNTAVTVTISGTDSLSGSGIAACSPSVVLSFEGVNQSAAGSCSDIAGNASATAVDSSINIDLTPPSVLVEGPPNGSAWPLGFNVPARYSCTDSLSGVSPANCTGPLPTGASIDTSAIGNLSFPVTATDLAGNATTVSANYSISSLPYDSPGGIWTIAGDGNAGYTGDGIPAVVTALNNPWGITTDSLGNLYIVDSGNQRIRKVDVSTGLISTVAGNGTGGFSGDGGLATAAQIYFAAGVAVDLAGNIYIADSNNFRVRRVDKATGVITTIAGNGAAGDSGDGGPATAAQFTFPLGLALDAAANLYIADQNSGRIRKIDAITGVISTVAGTGTPGYSGDGGPATNAQLVGPISLAIDGAGDIYIDDLGGFRIRRVDAVTGIITTVAGTGVEAYSGDGGPAVNAALVLPYSIALDSNGALFIADEGAQRVRRVDPRTGVIATFAGGGFGYAGDGGAALGASVKYLQGIAVDAKNTLYVSDRGTSRVRRIAGVPPSDASPPVITPTVAGTQGTNSWYTSNVSITWAVTDPESAISTKTGCSPASVTTDTAGQTITCSATSSGGTASQSVTIKRDATAPTVTISTPANGGNYVSGSAVNSAYSCADAISGIATCAGTAANGAAIDTSGTGTKAFTVTATDKAGNVTPLVVTYTVAVAAPAFTLAPSTVPFGSQALNVSTTAMPITLSSTGTSAVSVTSIRVTGTNGNQFSQTNNCGTSVAAGVACTINVVFRPTSAGAKTATITVVTGNAGTKTVNLTGTGVASSYSVSPTTIAFGSEQTNISTPAQTVTVTNSASVALPLTSVTLGGTNANQYSQTNTCGTSVAAGSTCTISVIFTPTSAGAKSATLTVRPTVAATQTVALSGTGIVPTYTVTPSPLAFGSQAVGVASAAQTLTLTNTGTLVLPVTSIALSGGNTNQFSLSRTCGASLAPSTTCSITVVFTPTSSGAKSTTVRVTASGGAATVSVPVTGTGVVPTYALSPTSLAYGNQARNTSSAAQSITLTNTGTLDLLITSVTLTGGNANQFSQTNSCGTLVTAGSTCTINVVFKPTSTGNKTATLRVTPGGGAATQSVSLTGTGI